MLLRRALLAALAALLLLPALAAAAPDTIVNFEGIPDNTQIADQYASSGVRFGAANQFGFPQPSNSCGAPYASSPGVSGTSARIDCRTGPSEFPTRFFGTAIEFATERRAVSFKLFQKTDDAPQTATISAYAIGGVLLDRHTVSLPRDQVVSQSFSHATTDGGIVGIVIQGDLDMYDSSGVFLDDVDATLDDVPPPKKFSLALSTPSIDVVEGGSASSTLSVRRYNGSSGPVTLSIDALPSGLVSSQFSTNPVTGVDPVRLQVTADAPFAGTRELTITATGGAQAGTAIGASLVQTINALPAVTFATGGRFPVRLVPGCGEQQIQDSVDVGSDISDTGLISTRDFPPGLEGGPVTNSVRFNGRGVYPFTYELNPGNRDASGTATIDVIPFHATKASLTVHWLTDRVTVASVTPSPALPLADGGNTVTVVGNFPSICPVTFQDGAGQVWPVHDFQPSATEVNGRAMDVVTLNMPYTAVSGPLSVIGANRAVLTTTAPIDVREFRNVHALRQVNGGDGARGTYNWVDFERTFGDDDAEDCFIICVKDPTALAYYHRWSALVQAGNGLCTGWAIIAARFHGFNGTKDDPATYQPGATRAWQITGFADGTAVKRDVVRWWVAQNDQSMLKARLAGVNRSASDEAKLLKDLINEQGVALVTISQDSSGHAVLAYGYQVLGDGSLKVAIYDPNLPYDPAEATNRDYRKTQLDTSSITIQPDGSWRGSSEGWSGPNARLAVVDQLPPEDASLPDGSVVLPTANSAADVTEIDAGGRPVWTSGHEARAGGGVLVDPIPSGTSSDPQFRLDPGKSYDITLRGSAGGRAGAAMTGKTGSAGVSDASTRAGQVDHLTVRPGQASLDFSTGAGRTGVTYNLIGRAGRASRTADIKVTAGNGGSDSAEITGGTVRLDHQGAPTTASITMGSVGDGLPETVSLATLKVGRDQSLALTPSSWGDLGGGVRYVVRTAGGRVVKRGTARIKSSGRVALSGVSAKRKGRTVTVRGHVTKRGTSPVLAATVEMVKHGKVVSRKATTLTGAKVKKGAFTLKVRLGKTPFGARARVTVLLIDDGADAGSARKVVKLHH